MAGIEAFHRPQQPEVAFLDQVLQTQAFAGVAAGDVDDQSQVGADHPVAGPDVAVADPMAEFLLVVGGQQSRFVDFAEVGFQRRLDRALRLSRRCRLAWFAWHVRFALCFDSLT